MPASRDEFILIRRIGETTIQVEAHFDPDTELWNLVTSFNGRIVEVDKCERTDIFEVTRREVYNCVALHEQATIEPSRALDSAEPETHHSR